MNDFRHHPPTAPTPALGRLGAAAARAAGNGWRVFPAVPRGKVPAIADWEKAATTDLDQITAWWLAMPWNVAVSTGPSDLLVIDLDASGGASAPPQWAGARGGHDVLERLAAAAGEPPPSDTYTVATPGGTRWPSYVLTARRRGQDLHHQRGRDRARAADTIADGGDADSSRGRIWS